MSLTRASAEDGIITGPVCFSKGEHMLCCATLADRATGSNTPVQLVHGHAWTDMYVCCDTSSLETDQVSPLQAELMGPEKGGGV